MLKRTVKTRFSRNKFLSKVSYSVLAITCIEQSVLAMTTVARAPLSVSGVSAMGGGKVDTGILRSTAKLPSNPQVLAGKVEHLIQGNQMLVTSKESVAWVQYDLHHDGVFLGKEGKMNILQDPSATFIIETKDERQGKVLGQISSLGSLVMAFPGGLYFGDGSKLDVKNLVVTAARIDNAAFKEEGKIKFKVTNPNAVIVNQGQMTVADKGLAAFVGPNVANHGVVIARTGKVHLETGVAATVDFNGDGLVNFQVTSEHGKESLKKAKDLAEKAGAEKGIAAFTTEAAVEVVKGLVNVSVAEGKTARVEAGEIVIGGVGAAVNVGPQSVIKLEDENGDGGKVALRGQTNTVSGTIDVSSAKGKGGTILFGGDWHGGRFGEAYETKLSKRFGLSAQEIERIRPGKFTINTRQNADFVELAEGGLLDVSGYQEGGKVVSWSEYRTTLKGSILGRSELGRGAFIEGSGAKYLTRPASFRYDNHGTLGKGITLWDPKNIGFRSGASGTISNAPWVLGDEVSIIQNSTIVANEIYTADDWIVVQDPISIVGGGLTLNAGKGIQTRGQIQAAGNLRFVSDQGGLSLDGDLITTNSGNVIIAVQNNIDQASSNVKVQSSGGISLTASGDVGRVDNQFRIEHGVSGFIVGNVSGSSYITSGTSTQNLIFGDSTGIDGVKSFQSKAAAVTVTGTYLGVSNGLSVAGDGIVISGIGSDSLSLTIKGDLNIDAPIQALDADVTILSAQDISGIGLIESQNFNVENGKSLNVKVMASGNVNLSNISGDVHLDINNYDDTSIVLQNVGGVLNFENASKISVRAIDSSIKVGTLISSSVDDGIMLKTDKHLILTASSNIQTPKLSIQTSDDIDMILNPKDGADGNGIFKTNEILNAWTDVKSSSVLVFHSGGDLSVEDNASVGSSLILSAEKDIILNDSVETTGPDSNLSLLALGSISRSDNNVKVVSSGDLILQARGDIGAYGTFSESFSEILQALDVTHGVGKKLTATSGANIYLVSTSDLDIKDVSATELGLSDGSVNITVLEGYSLTVSEQLKSKGEMHLDVSGRLIWNGLISSGTDGVEVLNIRANALSVGVDADYETKEMIISKYQDLPITTMTLGSNADQFDINALVNAQNKAVKLTLNAENAKIVVDQTVKKTTSGASDFSLSSNKDILFAGDFSGDKVYLKALEGMVAGMPLSPGAVHSEDLTIEAKYLGGTVDFVQHKFYMTGVGKVITSNPIYISAPGDVTIKADQNLTVGYIDTTQDDGSIQVVTKDSDITVDGVALSHGSGTVSFHADGALTLTNQASITAGDTGSAELSLIGNYISVADGAEFFASDLVVGTSDVDLEIYNNKIGLITGQINVIGLLSGWKNNIDESLKFVSGGKITVKENLAQSTRPLSFDAVKEAIFEGSVAGEGLIVKASSISGEGQLDGSTGLIVLEAKTGGIGSALVFLNILGSGGVRASSVGDIYLKSTGGIAVDSENIISSAGNVVLDVLGEISGAGGIGAALGVSLKGSSIEAKILHGYVVAQSTGSITLTSGLDLNGDKFLDPLVDGDITLGGASLNGLSNISSTGINSLITVDVIGSIFAGSGVIGDIISGANNVMLSAGRNIGLDKTNMLQISAVKDVVANAEGSLYLKTTGNLNVGENHIKSGLEMVLDIGGNLAGIGGLDSGASIDLKVGGDVGSLGSYLSLKHGSKNDLSADVTGEFYATSASKLKLKSVVAKSVDLSTVDFADIIVAGLVQSSLGDINLHSAGSLLKSGAVSKVMSANSILLDAAQMIGQDGMFVDDNTPRALAVSHGEAGTFSARAGTGIYVVSGDVLRLKEVSSGDGSFILLTTQNKKDIKIADNINFGDATTFLFSSNNITMEDAVFEVSGKYLSLTADGHIGSRGILFNITSPNEVGVFASGEANIASNHKLKLGSFTAGKVNLQASEIDQGDHSITALEGVFKIRDLEFVTEGSKIIRASNGSMLIEGSSLTLTQGDGIAHVEDISIISSNLSNVVMRSATDNVLNVQSAGPIDMSSEGDVNLGSVDAAGKLSILSTGIVTVGNHLTAGSGELTIIGAQLKAPQNSLHGSTLKIGTPEGLDMYMVNGSSGVDGQFILTDIFEFWADNAGKDLTLSSGGDFQGETIVYDARKLILSSLKDIGTALNPLNISSDIGSSLEINPGGNAYVTSDKDVRLLNAGLSTHVSTLGKLFFAGYTFSGTDGVLYDAGTVRGNSHDLTMDNMKMSSDSNTPYWNASGLQGGEHFQLISVGFSGDVPVDTSDYVDGAGLVWFNNVLHGTGSSMTLKRYGSLNATMNGSPSSVQWTSEDGLSGGSNIVVGDATITGAGLKWDGYASVDMDMNIDSLHDVGIGEVSLGVNVPGKIYANVVGNIALASGRAIDLNSSRDLHLKRVVVMEHGAPVSIHATNGSNIHIFGEIRGIDMMIHAEEGVIGLDSTSRLSSVYDIDLMGRSLAMSPGGELYARQLTLGTSDGQQMRLESGRGYGKIDVDSFVNAWQIPSEDHPSTPVREKLILSSGSDMIVATPIYQSITTRLVTRGENSDIFLSQDVMTTDGANLELCAGRRIMGDKEIFSSGDLNLTSGKEIMGGEQALIVSAIGKLFVYAGGNAVLSSPRSVTLGGVHIADGRFSLSTNDGQDLTALEDIQGAGIKLQSGGDLNLQAKLVAGNNLLDLYAEKEINKEAGFSFTASALSVGVSGSSAASGLKVYQTGGAGLGNLNVGDFLSRWTNDNHKDITLKSTGDLSVVEDLALADRNVSFDAEQKIKFEANVRAQDINVRSSDGGIYQTSGKKLFGKRINFNVMGQDIGTFDHKIALEATGGVSVGQGRFVYLISDANLILSQISALRSIHVSSGGDVIFEQGISSNVIDSPESIDILAQHVIANGRKLNAPTISFSKSPVLTSDPITDSSPLRMGGVDALIKTNNTTPMTDMNALVNGNGMNIILDADWHDLLVDAPIRYTNGNLSFYGRKITLNPASVGQVMVTTGGNQLTFGARSGLVANGAKVDTAKLWVYDYDSDTVVDSTPTSIAMGAFSIDMLNTIVQNPATTELDIGPGMDGRMATNTTNEDRDVRVGVETGSSGQIGDAAAKIVITGNNLDVSDTVLKKKTQRTQSTGSKQGFDGW